MPKWLVWLPAILITVGLLLTAASDTAGNIVVLVGGLGLVWVGLTGWPDALDKSQPLLRRPRQSSAMGSPPDCARSLICRHERHCAELAGSKPEPKCPRLHLFTDKPEGLPLPAIAVAA